VKTKQGLTPLEYAAEMSYGVDESAPPLPEVDAGLDPLRALEDAVLPCLERPPCVVSFSGGRDSSAVLAAATQAARREGLPLPIPVTLRYPDSPEADESAWQELVVRHLDLHGWERLEQVRGERDLLGPLARRVLRRHGVLAPFGVYSMIPILERAAGGSMLTGEDGDGLFGSWPWARAFAVLRRRARPETRDLVRLAHLGSPAAVRRQVVRRLRSFSPPWLRPEAAAAFRAAREEHIVAQPRRWDRRVAWWSRLRYVGLIRSGYEIVAADHDVHVLHPFFERPFLAALARRGGWSGFGGRTETMRAVFSSVLPEAVLVREDKGDFTSPAWGPDARAFLSRWSGGGVPGDLVDEKALRREWASPFPDIRTALLLHGAWLEASAGAAVDEPVDDLSHGGPASRSRELPAR
jgi:asparagine synthetase B (glutamine-hydrolysing)